MYTFSFFLLEHVKIVSKVKRTFRHLLIAYLYNNCIETMNFVYTLVKCVLIFVFLHIKYYNFANCHWSSNFKINTKNRFFQKHSSTSNTNVNNNEKKEWKECTRNVCYPKPFTLLTIKLLWADCTIQPNL